jgi:type II secretion system protein G
MLKKKGFTLIELLIVIVIIGILAGIVVGIVGTNARRRANDTKKKADFHELQNALEQYYVDKNEYPTGDTIAALSGLFTPAAGETKYLSVDPTTMASQSGGKDYNYTSDGATYSLSVQLEDTNATGPGVTTEGSNKVYTVTSKQ